MPGRYVVELEESRNKPGDDYGTENQLIPEDSTTVDAPRKKRMTKNEKAARVRR